MNSAPEEIFVELRKIFGWKPSFYLSQNPLIVVPYFGHYPPCPHQSNGYCSGGQHISWGTEVVATPRRILFPLFNMHAIVVCGCVSVYLCGAKNMFKSRREPKAEKAAAASQLASQAKSKTRFQFCCYCFCCCCCCFCGIVASFKASCELQLASMAVGCWLLALGWFWNLDRLHFGRDLCGWGGCDGCDGWAAWVGFLATAAAAAH